MHHPFRKRVMNLRGSVLYIFFARISDLSPNYLRYWYKMLVKPVFSEWTHFFFSSLYDSWLWIPFVLSFIPWKLRDIEICLFYVMLQALLLTVNVNARIRRSRNTGAHYILRTELFNKSLNSRYGYLQAEVACTWLLHCFTNKYFYRKKTAYIYMPTENEPSLCCFMMFDSSQWFFIVGRTKVVNIENDAVSTCYHVRVL